MPKVSIIVPLFNKSKYIAATLESILHQKFEDYEVIIINDGSTDDGPQIVEGYAEKDHRICLLNIPNGGVSNARNVGLKHARGEWIQFLDGDDLIDPQYLSEGIALAESVGVDILFTNFQMIDENGKLVKQVFNQYQGTVDQEGLCRNFIEYQYKNGFFGYISNKLIRRKLLEKSKAVFPIEICLAEDLDFYAHLYPYVQKAYFAPINSFFYLQTDTNYQNNSMIDYYSQLIVHLDIKRWFVTTNQYSQYQKILDRKVGEYVYFVLFHTNESGKSIKGYFSKIGKSDEILECIHPEQFNGFIRWLLKAVAKKSYNTALVLLNGRKMIRGIYRRGRKNGRNIPL
jgi:glycosyltransferase involved in cell wall biosynthesis